MAARKTEVVEDQREVQQDIWLGGGELVLADEVWLKARVERGDDGGAGARTDWDLLVAGAAVHAHHELTVRLQLGGSTGDEEVAGLAAVDLAGCQPLLAQINFHVGNVSKDQVREGLVAGRGADVVTEQLQLVNVGRVGAERLVGVCEDEVKRPPWPRLSGGQVELRPRPEAGSQDQRQEKTF